MATRPASNLDSLAWHLELAPCHPDVNDAYYNSIAGGLAAYLDAVDYAFGPRSTTRCYRGLRQRSARPEALLPACVPGD